VDVLTNLSHPNIIKMVDHQETTNNYYEFLEYLEKPTMTLSEMLKLNGSTVPPSIAAKIFGQLVGAIAYMHANGFGHRDLNPDNIMVNPQTLHVTLIDFGFATRTNAPCEDFSGSPIYAAPEILNFEAYSVDQADLWSLGVVLYQMCFGVYPYPAKDLQELTHKVNRMPLSIPSGLTGPLVDLVAVIQGLMQKDPNRRTTAGSLAAFMCTEEERSFIEKAPAAAGLDILDDMDIEMVDGMAPSSLS